MAMTWCFRIWATVALAVVIVPAHAQTPREPIQFDQSAMQAQYGAPIPCTDSTGAYANDPRNPHCAPCSALNPTPAPNGMLEHSRRLVVTELLLSRTPSEAFQRCVRHGLESTYLGLRDTLDVEFEVLSYNVFGRIASLRASAREDADRRIVTLLNSGDSIHAARLTGILGEAVLDRAERLLSHATDLTLRPLEIDARELRASAIPFLVLPELPATSDVLGASESKWARALFDLAAQLGRSNERLRERYVRLSLSTLVMERRWPALDSAARIVLRQSPRDSVAPLAIALAAFNRVAGSVMEYPAANELFDAAFSAISIQDVRRYGSFNHVLSSTADFWRGAYRDDDRAKLDARSWAVIDPLWLTPVNEVLLTRHARMSDADFRYARLVKAGESGSETDIGMVQLKRGVPDARWTFVERGRQRYEYLRWFPGKVTMASYQHFVQGHWASIYSDDMQPQRRIHHPVGEGGNCSRGAHPTLFRCVKYSNSDWSEVPIEEKRDTIDVAVARFRAPNDSIDLYISSRLPTRWFWGRTSPLVTNRDSILYGVTVANAFGETRFHAQSRRALPGRERSWTAQWNARVPGEHMMHRVEAFLPIQKQMAIGSRMLTSAQDAQFTIRGFGMSDVLIADSAVIEGPVQSWRDLRIAPNAAVIETGGSLALAWEIYDLAPDSTGQARWRVSVSRESGRTVIHDDVRSIIVGALGAGVQVVANEPGANMISYARADAASKTIIETLRFQWPTVSPGRHVLIVRIEDTVSGRTAQRAVNVLVRDPKSAR